MVFGKELSWSLSKPKSNGEQEYHDGHPHSIYVQVLGLPGFDKLKFDPASEIPDVKHQQGCEVDQQQYVFT